MKKTLILGLAVLSLAGCWRQFQPNPDPNHSHADFAVWINGTQLDFTADKYMSAPPAETSLINTLAFVATSFAHEGEEAVKPLPGREYLHLHDGNGHVIHRHKPELTIGDFFHSIGFEMQKTCFRLDTSVEVCNAAGKEWKMFVNGEEKEFDPAFIFADMDKILLTYGSNQEDIDLQIAGLTDEACMYSQTCPWKGDAPTENCIADPAIPCVVPEEDL